MKIIKILTLITGFNLYAVNTSKHIDLAFVNKQEGFRLNGYIPVTRYGKVVGNSGVTIAGGLDLGQRTHLRDLKLSSKIKNKLKPYLNIRRKKALIKLNKEPLELSREEAILCQKATHNAYFKKLTRFYKKHTKKDFRKLPKAFKTVLYNLYYNTGTVGKRALKYASMLDNVRLVYELFNYYKKGSRNDLWFGPKRATEAQYLLLR